MASQTQLEILIKTIADARGITITEQEVKKLTESLKEAQAEAKAVDNSADALAKQFGEANQKAGEFGRSLKGLSDDQLLSVEERLREQIRTTKEAGGNVDELKRKLNETFSQRTTQQVDNLSGSLKRATDAKGQLARVGNQLNRGLNDTQKAMAGLGNITAGLSRGGFAGMVQAGRGVIGVLSGITRFAGPVGIALGGVGLVLAVVSKRAKEAREEMERLTKQGEENAAKYGVELVKLAGATEKLAAAQKEQLSELSAGYQRLAEDIGKATARAEADTKRRKELELAAARNPEERAAVEKRFEAIDLENRELRATQEQQVAERERTDLIGRRDSARLGVSQRDQEATTRSGFAEEAAKDAENSRAELEALQERYNTFVQEQANGFTIDAEEFARVKAAIPRVEKRTQDLAQRAFDLAAKAEAAKADAEEARKNLAELEASLAAEIDAVEARIEAAVEALKDVATARVAQAISEANAAAATIEADRAAISDLEKQRKAAADSNDPVAFRKAEQAIAEKQRAIAGRSSTVAAGDSARAANNLPPANGRAPTPSREAGTITRGDDTVTVNVGGNEPAQTGGVIRRGGQVVSDTRQVADSLKKESQALDKLGEVIVTITDEKTKKIERIDRQARNSREKAQP